MKPNDPVLSPFDLRTRVRQFGLTLWLALLTLFAIPARAQLPFAYTNDNGQIVITKYLGSGGSVSIPPFIGDLPVTRIADSAFYQSTWQLGEVIIPNSVTSIGDSAFESCTGLTNVVIGTGVTNIGKYAFSGCPLPSIVVPDSVITVGDGAFFSSGLKSASIGNGVVSIGTAAFGFCSNLRTITIGSGITRIGSAAFGYCSLDGVYFRGNPPELEGLVFEHLEKTIIYYLPETVGWTSTFGGRSTRLWNPKVMFNDATFGVKAGEFGFTISGTSNLIVVVEASSDLLNPVWIPVGTNILAGGSSFFADQHRLEDVTRAYRLRSP